MYIQQPTHGAASSMDRRGKKRQREEVLPHPVPTPESSSTRAGGDDLHAQDPPPQEEAIDRISNLPDGVLGDIVSLLRMKEGARTQILSTRWLHSWQSAPLNLNLFEFSNNNRRAVVSTVSRIVANHSGPGKLFRVPWYYPYHYRSPLPAL
jgi:hypothetical protein